MPIPSTLRSLSFWMVLLIWGSVGMRALNHAAGNIFVWDSFGYHLYLPATIDHHDPLLKDMTWVQNVRSTYGMPGTLYQISDLPDGHRVIKYPMGLAVIWSPWYLAGHISAGLTGHPQDGYSTPYGICVRTGTLLYLLMGLFALSSVLRRHFTDRITALTILLLFAGTNLIDQATMGLAMPHLPLFALYCGILWAVLRWTEQRSPGRASLLAVLMGLATLIRPSEAIVVLLPLLWHTADEEHGALRRAWAMRGQWAMIVGVMFLIGLPQFLYWKAATGHWVLDTYNNAGEGFDLSSPHTWPFLFSFRKGWYIYTPMMVIATAGIALLRSHWRAASLPVTVFFVLNLYLLSSWTCWWYADSFGSRAMVGSYAVMAIPLAGVLHWSATGSILRRWAMGALFGACVVLNLFQYGQFNAGILHSSRMTRAAYFAILGRTTAPDGMQDLLLVERSYSGDQGRPDPGRYTSTPFPHTDRGVADTTLLDTLSGHMHPVYRLDKDRPFSPAVRIPFQAITSTDHAWLEAQWHVLALRNRTQGSFISTFEHDGKSYAYNATDLDIPDSVVGHWTTIHTYYLTPEVRNDADPFVCYFWLRDTVPVLVDGPYLIVHRPLSVP